MYAIYDSEADSLAGKRPFYVGIGDDAKKRFKQHKKDGRIEKGNFMVVHAKQIEYAKARGLEQKMIEDYGTKTGLRGKAISSGKKGNRGNKNNSFDKNRTDENGVQNGDCLEGFHHPRGGVGILPDNRSEINVEVVYHDIAEFGQADVRPTVFITKKI